MLYSTLYVILCPYDEDTSSLSVPCVHPRFQFFVCVCKRATPTYPFSGPFRAFVSIQPSTCLHM